MEHKLYITKGRGGDVVAWKTKTGSRCCICGKEIPPGSHLWVDEDRNVFCGGLQKDACISRFKRREADPIQGAATIIPTPGSATEQAGSS